MPAKQANQLFWLNYAQALKNKGRVDLSTNNAFFIAGKAMNGPVVGNSIPEEYTNQGIYEAADSLLTSDNLFYKGSSPPSFSQSLQSYLNWVELDGNHNPQLDRMLQEARKDQEASQATFNKSRDKAIARYAKESARGLTSGMNFSNWVQMNAPDYSMASRTVQEKSSRIQQIQSQIGGSSAEEVLRVQGNLGSALSGESPRPGCTMSSTVGNETRVSELLEAQSNGEHISSPSTVLVPAYAAPTYRTVGQKAQQTGGGGYTPSDSIQLSIDPGDNISKYNFGQVNGAESAGGSYGWLSFNPSDSHDEGSTTLDTGNDASSVKIKITFNEVSQVPVQPGAWADGVFNFKLSKDAPGNLKKLVRPAALIVVSNLGYEISFTSGVASAFSSKFSETTNSGGSMSVFGLEVNLDGDRSEESSHKATWDASSNTLKVVPNDKILVPTILGMVGDKVSSD